MTLEEELKEWQRCNEERLRLSREADTFKKRCEQLEEKFEKLLTDSGKSSIIRSGFTLCWVAGKTSIPWADEYLKECGPEKALKLKNAVAKSDKRSLSIVVPA